MNRIGYYSETVIILCLQREKREVRNVVILTVICRGLSVQIHLLHFTPDTHTVPTNEMVRAEQSYILLQGVTFPYCCLIH